MPGVLKNDKPEIAGAICGPPQPVQNEIAQEAREIPQPRQPTNLQGLLRYAMEANSAGNGSSTSTTLPMDEERKRFLEAALKSMTVDVIELLQKQIKTLENADTLTQNDDIAPHTAAIETILEHIDNIDIANDFHKIGGFDILKPCLKSVHKELRVGACDVLAELTQNNPYCQRVAVEQNYLPLLLDILEKDEEIVVVIKALYAISCFVRDCTDGFNQLINYGGLSILLKTLEKDEDKLRTKITFLLSTMCRMKPDLKSRLVFLNYVPVLIKLISEERKPSHEHVLSLLVSLVEENHAAVNECRNSRYNFNDVLRKYLDDIKNKPECLEEEEYCRRLQRILFAQQNGL